MEMRPDLSNSSGCAGPIKRRSTSKFRALKGDADSIKREESRSHSSGVKSHRQRSIPCVIQITSPATHVRSFAGSIIRPFSSRLLSYLPVSKVNPLPATFYHIFPRAAYLRLKKTNVNIKHPRKCTNPHTVPKNRDIRLLLIRGNGKHKSRKALGKKNG